MMNYPSFSFLRRAPRLRSSFLFLLASTSSLLASDWTLVWGDEFDYEGAPDPSKWTYETGGGGWGNAEVQVYTDSLDNARVESGRLLIQAHQTEGARVPGYTSARLLTRERQSFQYGRFEVRAKLPSETGTWSAIWFLATDALLSPTFWPNNGEIDLMEQVGYEEDPLFWAAKGTNPGNNIHATLHTEMRNHLAGSGIGGSTRIADAANAFHVYAMEWTPNRLEFFVDDVSFLTIRKDRDVGISQRNPPADTTPFWPFDQRFHLLLNIAVGGSWGGHFNSNFYPQSPYGLDGINHEGEWPQTMEIDYVRYFQPTNAVAEQRTVAPGVAAPVHYAAESGFLFERRMESEALVLRSVDAGDFITHEIHAAEAGDYTVALDVLATTSTFEVSLHNARNDQSLLPGALPVTGTGSWGSVSLGTLRLERGLNRVTLTAESAGGRLGDLHFTLPEAGTWEGLPVLAHSVVPTGAWLGPVSVGFAPWLYAPLIDSWLYPSGSAVDAVTPGSQWLYVYQPATFGFWQYDPTTGTTPTAPWAYSIILNKWIYAPPGENGQDLRTGQWLFLWE